MDMDIQQDGIVAFNDAIIKLKMSVPSMISQISFEASGLTIDATRPTIPVDSGDAARSLRHYLTNTGGAIAEGGATVDYFRWLALGGASGRKHTTKRSISDPDRYIYPGYLKSEKKIQFIMEEGLDKITRDAGLER